MKTLKSLSIWGAIAGATLSLPANAAALPGPLVSAQWLNEHLQEVVVLDVRSDLDTLTSAPQFEADEKSGDKKLSEVGGRIAGSLPVDFAKVRVSRTIEGKKIDKLLPDQAAFEDLMQTAGLNKGKPIVITSEGDAADVVEAAARLYWTLKVYGEEQLALLDGGVAAWIDAGYPVVTTTAQIERGDWTAREQRRELLALTADVEQAVKDKIQLVDARPLPQYLGLSFKKPSVAAGGHVAGARNFPTDVRFKTAGTAQVFYSPADYRSIMKAQGIADAAPTITYCNTGHMASGMWFIQSEILGNRSVRLYDGSMHEWTQLGKPVVGVGG